MDSMALSLRGKAGGGGSHCLEPDVERALFSKNGRTVWENEGDGPVLSKCNREAPLE